MEIKNNNFNLLDKEEPIIKNIIYDDQTGDRLLIDSNNNHFLCDIFGRKKNKFLPTISGIANADERKNYPLTSRNSKSKKFLTELISSKNNASKEKNFIDYFPTTRKFEGYSNYPRPIVPPYSNLSSQKKFERNRGKIKNCLMNQFCNGKNKDYISKKNDNNGLSFLTYDLNEFDTLKYDSAKILKIIDDTFGHYREKYKYKLNMLKRDPKIKAIKKLKKFILANKENKIINGRKLKEYNPKLKEKYNITLSIIQKKPKSNDIIHRKINKLKSSKTLSKIQSIPKLKFSNLKNNDKNRESDEMKTITSSRDLTLGRKIKMNFGVSLYEEEAKKNQEKKKKMEEYLKMKTKDKSENKDNKEVTDKGQNLEEKNEENEISFISIINGNEKENNCKIKDMKKLEIINNNEKNLLKGFIKEESQKEKFMLKQSKPKLKSSLHHYLEDMELLKKTNTLAFKIEEKKEERNLIQLVKKKQSLRINVENLMKFKKHNKK